MKICPRCGHHCHDNDLYCNECKSDVSNVKPIKPSRLNIHLSHKSIGCLIVLVIIIVVALTAILMPKVFSGNCHASFGQYYRDMIPPNH